MPGGLSTGHLDEIAEALNAAPLGVADTRHTEAVAYLDDGTYHVFVQREYGAFDAALVQAEQRYVDVTLDLRTIGDHRADDEGIHAEMLAVASWLAGDTARVVRIGVSKAPCARCAQVLAHLGIEHRATDGVATRNWTHPARHAGLHAPPNGWPALPQKVTNGVAYAW